jgi:23S rRNA pseudouridine1911/1915/1917 synthase
VGGEVVELRIPESTAPQWQPQPIAVNVVYEDDILLVINKPAGLVVHPAPGNRDGTLLNAVLHHAPQLKAVARAGSALATTIRPEVSLSKRCTMPARLRLIKQLQKHEIKRMYTALVNGVMVAGGEIVAPIGRHPRRRTRMAVNARGKPAVSHYRVKAKYRAPTLVQIQLESGRTHQIRGHMTHIGYPIVGDPVYGGRLRLPPAAGERLVQALRGFRRQALHAAKLSLVHPVTGEAMEWTAPLPQDMKELIEVLEEDVLAPLPSRKGGGG